LVESASACRTEAVSRTLLTRVGVRHEWHLLLRKFLQYITFCLLPGLHEEEVLLVSAFPQPRFEPIWTVGDTMGCDRFEQLVTELRAEARVLLAPDGNHRLEGFERLNGPFEADRSWFDAILGCGLRHDRADEIVGQDVGPNLFTHEFRRLAAKNIHLQRDLQRLQVKFSVPPGSIQFGKVVLCIFVWIQQRRGDDEGLHAKTRLLDANTALADRQKLGKRGVGFSVDRARLLRFGPKDDVVVSRPSFRMAS